MMITISSSEIPFLYLSDALSWTIYFDIKDENLIDINRGAHMTDQLILLCQTLFGGGWQKSW